MITPLLHSWSTGRDEAADELQRHYWSLLGRLGLAGGSTAITSKTLGVTSSRSGEGVSSIAASLAVTAASSGQRSVLLVDANPDRPAAHRLLGVKSSPGLAEALADPSSPPSIQVSPMEGLAVLAAGSGLKGRAIAPAASSVAGVLKSIQDSFALVVVDLPPAEQGGLTVQLAKSLDGVLFVVEAERVRGEEIRRCRDWLVQAGVCLLGVVFNKQRRYVPPHLDRWV